ncbi:MAG: hypothetical protein CSA64_01330 [Arachnia propionica]|nr:MAG: hypothetical protein CSA64_01330 [Arachnia propionica]
MLGSATAAGLAAVVGVAATVGVGEGTPVGAGLAGALGEEAGVVGETSCCDGAQPAKAPPAAVLSSARREIMLTQPG